ncbi:MAG TPA: hypothetical protein VLS89_05575, partial [Candidatus Nanopelagicales bacterium]|nr:hypothetical protein [Candidatus Nanopelagicales bacterium]
LAAARPRNLAVTADALYWSDVQVWRLPLAGGDAAPLFPEALDPGALAMDATHAYFTEDTQGAVMRVALDASAPPQLIAMAERPMAVAVDPTHVYWTQAGPPGDQVDGALMRAPLDGSAAPELLAMGTEPDGLTLALAGVIWADGGAGAVLLTPRAGGATTPLATDQPRPNHVATDDVYAYWTDPLEGHVAKAPLSGGPVSLVSQAHTGAAGITYREETLYWVADQDNALLRIQADSKQMREMIRFDGELTNITAVDASYVYYATTYPDGSGAVKRVAR